MRRRREICLILAAGALLAGGCRHREAGMAVTPISVAGANLETVKAEARTLTDYADAVGTVEAQQTANLSPKIMSRVTAVYVREGDRVRQGDVLVRLEAADLSARTAQARAGQQSALAGRSQAETAYEMQVTQSAVDVQQAEASVQSARANLDKVRHGPRPQEKAQAEQGVAAARAAWQGAQAQLDLAKEGARRQEKAQASLGLTAATEGVNRSEQALEQAKAGLTQAKAALKAAELDHKRAQGLYDQQVIPKQQLDHADLQYESAQQQVAQAQAQVGQAEAAVRQARAGAEQARQQQSIVEEGSRSQEIRMAEERANAAKAAYEQANEAARMALAGGREEDIRVAEAAVRQAEQQLVAARAATGRTKLKQKDIEAADASVRQSAANARASAVMESYATITAPFDGIIAGKYVSPGDQAAPGTSLIKIDDDSRYRIAATVPEDKIAALTVGSAVTGYVDALGAEALDARVSRVVPSADPASRTFVVKADLPRKHGIRSGMYGRVQFAIATHEGIVIPTPCVTERAGLSGVFTVDSQHGVRFRVVKAGPARGELTELLSGVIAGEAVVVRPEPTLIETPAPTTEGGAQG